jgi:hypothetical protein
MTRPRFLADEDLNAHLMLGLRRREPMIPFASIRDFGLEGNEDAKILDYAAAGGWILVSHDRSTMFASAQHRIVAKQSMTGLILDPQRARLAPVIDDLILIAFCTEAAEWLNRIEFLPIG